MTGDAVITVEHVTVGYGDRVVLRDISLQIKRGQVHVLVGGSGCGKSTLLKNIIGLAEPLEGKITLLGEEVSEVHASDIFALLAKKVGILFQGGALLGSLSVFDNVALPLREHTSLPESIIAHVVGGMLAVVGLHQAHHLLPGELSGGMRKRAALARAMVTGPELLICDEPSAGLDPVTASGIDQLLINLRNRFGMTILIVTHELSSIQTIADSITMLHDQGIVFHGTLSDVQTSTHPAVRAFFDRAPGQQEQTLSIYTELCGGHAS